MITTMIPTPQELPVDALLDRCVRTMKGDYTPRDPKDRTTVRAREQGAVYVDPSGFDDSVIAEAILRLQEAGWIAEWKAVPMIEWHLVKSDRQYFTRNLLVIKPAASAMTV